MQVLLVLLQIDDFLEGAIPDVPFITAGKAIVFDANTIVGIKEYYHSLEISTVKMTAMNAGILVFVWVRPLPDLDGSLSLHRGDALPMV